ncbi:MAG: glycoside hydrolase [Polaribacter sp.]|nr:glycoside hydrolase [Polaribacter sp.]
MVICVATNCQKSQTKINGISYVASPIKIDSTHTKPIVNVNANYASLMPFAFIRAIDSPKVYFSDKRQWFGETEDGIVHYAQQLKQENIKIMLKPQIWVRRGEFTGLIQMNSENDWQTFENEYKKFILTFVKVAEKQGIHIFCIGTELELFVKYRPDFWRQLIKEIRTIYKGKLTYAANWDEFTRVPFWADLDFIGVDAYFPLSDKKSPTLDEYKNGWQPHKKVLIEYHQKYQKPILFTEYGYRSVDFNGVKPWDVSDVNGNVNLQAQATALEALYQEIWQEPWFAGGFVWKWFVNHEEVGGAQNNRFTPQNKPATQIIKKGYGKTY